jgi:hypothetical protein
MTFTDICEVVFEFEHGTSYFVREEDKNQENQQSDKELDDDEEDNQFIPRINKTWAYDFEKIVEDNRVNEGRNQDN